MEKRPFKDFTGTVDDLLNHCADVDPDKINDNTMLNHEELVDTIAEDWHVTKEEADVIAMEIKLEIVRDTIRDMAEKGLLEQIGYDDDGEPTWQLTEKGKRML